MANTDRLTEVVAKLHERDEEFRDFDGAKIDAAGTEPLWPVAKLKEILEYDENESLEKAINKAKVVAGQNGMSIKENFKDGILFGLSGETLLTKYAALLVIMNADVHKPRVASAQNYFALQVNRQQLEDEKRLKGRLDVANENHKLTGVAKSVGVENFAKFNGIGVSALYGGHNVKQIARMKGLKPSQPYLDFAGSEELAANLFRITQTQAALKRQTERNEDAACGTHEAVARSVRAVILKAGNLPPERLPAATKKIDAVATEVKKKLT